MTDYSIFEDSQLIHYARQDAQAFEALYLRYLPRLYRYCLHRVGDVHQAEDISAQVFFEVLNGLLNGKFKEDGCFPAWLFTIARRRVIDHYRQPNPEPLKETHPTHLDLPGLTEARDEQRQLSKLISELEDGQQELLRLRFAAEMSFEEIAMLDGRKPAAVKMAIYRTLDQLRARWEKRYGK